MWSEYQADSIARPLLYPSTQTGLYRTAETGRGRFGRPESQTHREFVVDNDSSNLAEHRSRSPLKRGRRDPSGAGVLLVDQERGGRDQITNARGRLRSASS